MKTLKIFFLFIAVSVTSLSLNAKDKSTNPAVDKIINAYLAVKNALVAGDGAAAGNKAKELLASVNALQTDNLTADQRKTWTTYQAKLQYDSRHISETKDVAHQREHFESLSKNLSAALKGLKLNSTTLYEQYCPMKKAYWLSDSETIKNPYFGNSMLTCGKVTATLAPAK